MCWMSEYNSAGHLPSLRAVCYFRYLQAVSWFISASFLKIPLLHVFQQENLIWLLKPANSHKSKSLLLFWKCKLKGIFFHSLFHMICRVYDNVLALLSPFVWAFKNQTLARIIRRRECHLLSCQAWIYWESFSFVLCTASGDSTATLHHVIAAV